MVGWSLFFLSFYLFDAIAEKNCIYQKMFKKTEEVLSVLLPAVSPDLIYTLASYKLSLHCNVFAQWPW